MYKLTVVSGPNRGTSYVLQEGETSVGRQTGNTIVVQSSKVSKRHCTFETHGNEVTLKDQGSSNGTFVNGALTKLKKLKPGDRVSVGEYVFELTEPPKKLSQPGAALPQMGLGAKPRPAAPGGAKTGGTNPGIPGAGMGLDPGGMGGLPGMGGATGIPNGMTGMTNLNTGSAAPANQSPKDLKGRLLWIFEQRLMPVFYQLNLKHEWKTICIGMASLMVVCNLVISVYPLLESSRVTIVKESGRRAKFMARQIAETNAPYIAARAETKSEIGLAETADGVRTAVLIDLDSRIIAPGSKLNQYLASGVEAAVASKARELFQAGQETGFFMEPELGTVVAVEPVKILPAGAVKNVIVAMALVSVDTSIATPDLGEVGMVYSETLILTGLIAGLVLLILFKITLKPFLVLNDDLDKALKGEISQVTHEFKFEELNPLWDIINSAVQRIPKSDSSMSMGQSSEVNIEEYVGPLRTICGVNKTGLIVLDSQQKISFMNPMFEEMSGIRSDGSVGQDITSIARDQSLAPFVSDLLSRAQPGSDGVSEDYEFSGISYKVHGIAFGSPAGGAKCFALVIAKHEG